MTGQGERGRTLAFQNFVTRVGLGLKKGDPKPPRKSVRLGICLLPAAARPPDETGQRLLAIPQNGGKSCRCRQSLTRRGASARATHTAHSRLTGHWWGRRPALLLSGRWHLGGNRQSKLANTYVPFSATHQSNAASHPAPRTEGDLHAEEAAATRRVR